MISALHGSCVYPGQSPWLDSWTMLLPKLGSHGHMVKSTESIARRGGVGSRQRNKMMAARILK